MSDRVLLLTAAINVGDTFKLSRKDHEVRLNDYLTALNKWLRETETKILFVDNTDYNIDSIKEKIDHKYLDRIEFFSIYSQDKSKKFGKGMGEFESIRYVLDNYKDKSPDTTFVKTNGRYFWRGLDSMNFTDDITCNFSQNLSFVDSRVFAFNENFFRNYFIPEKSELNDFKGVYFEHVLAKAVHRAMADGLTWSPINRIVALRGYNGSGGHKYSTIRQYLRQGLKIFLRKNFNVV